MMHPDLKSALMRSPLVVEMDEPGPSVRVMTRFKLPDGHNIDVFIRHPETQGPWILSDMGTSYGGYDLVYDKDRLIDIITSGYDVQFNGCELSTLASRDFLDEAIIRLVQACTLVSLTQD